MLRSNTATAMYLWHSTYTMVLWHLLLCTRGKFCSCMWRGTHNLTTDLLMEVLRKKNVFNEFLNSLWVHFHFQANIDRKLTIFQILPYSMLSYYAFTSKMPQLVTSRCQNVVFSEQSSLLRAQKRFVLRWYAVITCEQHGLEKRGWNLIILVLANIVNWLPVHIMRDWKLC